MGAPRRNRKQYDKPKDMWSLTRITADNALKEEYGLKNMRELWKVQTELSRLRSNVRTLLSGSSAHGADVQSRIIGRLSKYGISAGDATLDRLLDLNENAFLARRLQTVVFKRGMARTIRQSRQLITHGFISINGRRVNRPGYLVSRDEEQRVGYYKPIDLGMAPKRTEAESVAEPAKEAPKAE